jgi:hypothetical protein
MKCRHNPEIELFSCEEELPPEDGMYLITNNVQKDSIYTLFDYNDTAIGEYDGYGFKYGLKYISPLYWGHLPVQEKKYGKVKCVTE